MYFYVQLYVLATVLKQAIDTAMDLNPDNLDLKIPPELYGSAVHSEWENFNQYLSLLLSIGKRRDTAKEMKDGVCKST